MDNTKTKDEIIKDALINILSRIKIEQKFKSDFIFSLPENETKLLQKPITKTGEK